MTDQRHAVERDRWDNEDWDSTLKAMPRLKELQQRLEDLAYTAPRLVEDAHQVLARPVPRLVDTGDLRPAFRVNREIISRLQVADATSQLRQYTVGDPLASGLAALTMESALTELHEELAEARSKADEAEQAAEDYEEACDDAGVAPGSPEAQADDVLQSLAQAAQAASDALDQALDDAAPVIDRRAREAAQAAADDAEQTSTTMANWGTESGEMARLDPATRLALTERLTTDRMQRLAARLGRMRSELNAESTRRWDIGPDEIADVTVGNDLERLVSSELIGLCDPDLEVDFLDRFDRKQLLQYELRTRAKEARGAVIYVRDSSGSMFDPDDPDLFASAFGLVLLDVARRQRRGFRSIVFAGPNQPLVEFDMGDDASTCTLEERIAFAEFTMTGGTSFEGPLDRAAEMVAEDIERTGRSLADVVFATDGTANVSPEWLEAWGEKRSELGFRCYGLTIGLDPYAAIEAVSDYVAPVHNLIDTDEDVTTVFSAVTKPKEIYA